LSDAERKTKSGLVYYRCKVSMSRLLISFTSFLPIFT
jgi:hypothetical protein